MNWEKFFEYECLRIRLRYFQTIVSLISSRAIWLMHLCISKRKLMLFMHYDFHMSCVMCKVHVFICFHLFCVVMWGALACSSTPMNSGKFFEYEARGKNKTS